MNADEFESFAGHAGPRVVRFALARGASPDDAADIAQEALIVAWRRIADVPPDPSDATAWLIGVARRTMANRRRALQSRNSATERLAQQIKLEDAGTTGSDVDIALAALRAEDREILQLTYWEGLSTEQLALALDIRPATARKRLQRARDALRRRLRPEHPVRVLAVAAQDV